MFLVDVNRHGAYREAAVAVVVELSLYLENTDNQNAGRNIK
jgi:hypothetical protein